jgi:hypothetical protein
MAITYAAAGRLQALSTGRRPGNRVGENLVACGINATTEAVD